MSCCRKLKQNTGPQSYTVLETHSGMVCNSVFYIIAMPECLMCPAFFINQHNCLPQTYTSYRAPKFLSFKGVPSPLPRFFSGYFHPLFINLEGITACSKLLNFH